MQSARPNNDTTRYVQRSASRQILFGLIVAGMFLLGSGTSSVPAQAAAPVSKQAKAATVRLKAISESRQKGDLAEIARLLEAGAEVDVRNRFGVTPLFMASQKSEQRGRMSLLYVDDCRRGLRSESPLE